jgi:hypothetical protein
MSIYKRKLFNRGGQVSSRGVGITSGLVDKPVQKFTLGGDVKEKYFDNLEMLRSLDLAQERKPFSKFEAATPALLNFFGGLMSGKSLQKGAAGGFDILGQSLQSSTPLFAQAIEAKKAYDAVDPEAGIKETALTLATQKDDPPETLTMKPGDTLMQLNEATGTYEKIYQTESIKKDKKLYTIGPNIKLVDETGATIAQGLDKTENQLYKLDPGERLVDREGNEIAFFPDINDQVIKLNPGQIAYSADGQTVIAENKTSTNKIFKLSPGQVAYDGSGQVIAQLDDNEKEKLQYKILAPGEELYDTKGNLIATGTSVNDIADKYHDFKTADERFNFILKELEKIAGFKEDGTVNLDNLTVAERIEYNRILPLIDEAAAAQIKNWADYKKDNLTNINFIDNMSERIQLAKAAFERNRATGAVRGRLTPLFNVLLDVTGISIPQIINETFQKDILLENLTASELNRLKSALALSFQSEMKGQVNTFEQQLILQSLFSVIDSPEANELAFENLEYLNELKRQTVLISERVNSYSELQTELDKWKKQNRPSLLKTDDDVYQGIIEKYNIKPIAESLDIE